MIQFLPPQAAALATVAVLVLIGLTAGPRTSLAVAAVVVLAVLAAVTAGIIRAHPRRQARKAKA